MEEQVRQRLNAHKRKARPLAEKEVIVVEGGLEEEKYSRGKEDDATTRSFSFFALSSARPQSPVLVTRKEEESTQEDSIAVPEWSIREQRERDGSIQKCLCPEDGELQQTGICMTYDCHFCASRIKWALDRLTVESRKSVLAELVFRSSVTVKRRVNSLVNGARKYKAIPSGNTLGKRCVATVETLASLDPWTRHGFVMDLFHRLPSEEMRYIGHLLKLS